jgi:DNA ligase 1
MPTTPTRRCFVAGLLISLLQPAWARSTRLPLVLAQNAPADPDPAGWLVSEKLDGVRAYWDGSQLWFRSGLPVSAPAWFTAALPAVPLDGELWLGRGRFEGLVSAVRKQQPVDAEWRELRLMAFELPGASGPFEQRARQIEQLARQHPRSPLAAVVQQPVASREALQALLRETVARGGEGLMLHRADAPFVSGRTPLLLKLKPQDDAEAQVIGHLAGRGKHAGRLGALRVRTADGVVFHIGTGFSDAQRESPPPLGSWVTFTHQGLTDAGVPRFASYLRQRTL